MQFVSIEFLLFMALVFALYWLARKSVMLQNVILIGASWVFYGYVDPTLLLLINGYTLWSYLAGVLIERSHSKQLRKALMITAICGCLGVLGIYKYFNFFAFNISRVLAAAGLEPGELTIRLILPVGISFYTLQAVSYIIDVYRGTIRATRNPVIYWAFLSFFPQLVAGPIERASSLIPQFSRERHFSYSKAVTGMKRILWGYVKKVLIADNCAAVVNPVFQFYSELSAELLLLGIFLFLIQLYCDFSGYCDIARGTALLLGIDLSENFRFPLFATNLREFWQRWHISLYRWFTDYLYIPLGGSRKGIVITAVNIMIVFTLSGLWHGAQWNYVAWGMLGGFGVVIAALWNRYRNNCRTYQNNSRRSRIVGWMFTFSFMLLAFTFFRAIGTPAGFEMIGGVFSRAPQWDFSLMPRSWWLPLCLALMFLWVEFLYRHRGYVLNFQGNGLMRYKAARWGVCWLLAVAILYVGGSSQSFIYFQF